MRKAEIPKDQRDLFERFGEIVIGSVLGGSFNPRASELQDIYNAQKPDILKNAADWLTERGDAREQHEQRLETLEWAILIFVILGVIADSLLVAQGFGWRP